MPKKMMRHFLVVIVIVACTVFRCAGEVPYGAFTFLVGHNCSGFYKQFPFDLGDCLSYHLLFSVDTKSIKFSQYRNQPSVISFTKYSDGTCNTSEASGEIGTGFQCNVFDDLPDKQYVHIVGPLPDGREKDGYVTMKLCDGTTCDAESAASCVTESVKLSSDQCLSSNVRYSIYKSMSIATCREDSGVVQYKTYNESTNCSGDSWNWDFAEMNTCHTCLASQEGCNVGHSFAFKHCGKEPGPKRTRSRLPHWAVWVILSAGAFIILLIVVCPSLCNKIRQPARYVTVQGYGGATSTADASEP